MKKILAALIASVFAMSTAFAASHAGAPAMPASAAAKKEEKKAAAAEKKTEKKAAAAVKKEEAKK